MNIINVKVNFTKGTCETTGINLITGDYNSTKLVFQFDREDGTKIFEMKSPSEELVMVQEIQNNEIILYGLDENENIASIFTEEGKYIFEVSLYESESKLTSAKGQIKVKPEQVVIDDEVVEAYIPVFDQLLNDITTTVQGLQQDVDDKLDEVDTKLGQVDSKILEVNDKLDDVDDKITEVDGKIATIEGQIETTEEIVDQANNLDLDISKSGKTTTVTITKKDETTESENILDGKNLEFVWSGTSLGVRVEGDSEYTYVNLQGIQGPVGPQGEPFKIKKTYSSISEMEADFNNMSIGDYVMIANSVETEDNAKLYTKTTQAWVFITDFSGATGIQGPTGPAPSISIGTVISGDTSSVTRTGTDENPVFNFVLEKGDKGETGDTGATGATGNGISNIQKTSTSGLVDTYTITYTDGTTQTYEVTNGEDGEVTQSQLDEVIAENDYLNSIIDQIVPKTTATGTSITLDNTIQAKMNMSLSPSELSQETTTGKNKLNVSSNYSVTGRVEMSLTLPAGTYHITCGQVTNGGSNSPVLVGFGNWFYLNSNGDVTRTLSQDTTLALEFYSNGYNYKDSQGITSTIQNLMISTEGGDYEPYTYGVSPNPQYPSQVHTISGDNTIKVYGRNLGYTGWAEDFVNRINDNTKAKLETYDNKNCLFYTASAGVPDYDTKYMFKTNWKANTQYTISYYGKSINGFLNLVIEHTDGTTVGIAGTPILDWTKVLLTSTANKTIKYIRSYWSGGNTYIDLDTFMVYEGTEELDYESYQEQTAQVNLGDLEYSKIGNYADEFYRATDSDTNLISGKWYLKKNIGKVVLDGNETWQGYTTLDNETTCWFQRAVLDEALGVLAVSNNYLYSDYFSIYNCYDASNTNPGLCYHVDKKIQVRFPKSLLSDTSSLATRVASFKAWLSNNNTTVYYILATPQYILLNDTLQSQLDTIESMLLSYKGQTNISQINNDLPFVITSTALKDLEDLNV